MIHCWNLGCIRPRVPATIVRTGRTHMRLGYIEFNEREQSILAPCFCSGDDMCLTLTACPDRLVEVSRGQGQRQPL